MAKSSGKSKKKKRVEPVGQVHISSSFNNIIITITDLSGNTISWSAAGKMGFRGSKK
ncbi:MAG: 30S ribosomal protein S11, partial [Bacteroidota bacterium]